MMTEHESPLSSPKLRKLVVALMSGGLVGFLMSIGILRLVDSDVVGGLSKSATIAALIGGFYCVIALGMLVGTTNPRLGARFLNVEDADELREQRRALNYSSVGMGLWGISLLALALAAPDGPVPQAAALVLGAGGLLIGSALSVLVYRMSDELMLAVNLEAGAITYALVLLVVGGWAILAHLGLTAGPQPLDLLSLFYGLVLIASFIAIGRRGMLTVR